MTRPPLGAVVATLLCLSAGPAPAQQSGATDPKSAPALAAMYGDSWAVIVGINDYAHPRVPKLRYAVNDARSVERTLRGQGFPPDRVITLLDSDATKARIETVLGDELRQRIGPNDRVLIFFAGHGKTDRLVSGEEEGYLLPVDGDPGRLFGTAISMTALRQISDRLPAKHILYVVDACYSGYALFNRSISDDLLQEMVRKRAIQILTAGRQEDQAQERAGHGVFTEVLLRGLGGEAFPGKDWLALEELGLWVKQRVFAESNKRQLPQFGSLSGEGQFVFLKPLGSLAVTAALSGVEVWAGDRKLGETTAGRALVAELPAGAYALKARKEGYRERVLQVQVRANQRAEVDIDIEPLRTPVPAARADDGAEMVLVPAGEFWMGSTPEEADREIEACTKSGDEEAACRRWLGPELPRHRVSLNAFYIDRHEVTNLLLERFVKATGHVSTAEREGSGEVWGEKEGKRLWLHVAGATWREPSGPGSKSEPTHPAVQVSWYDASAYCKWAGKRLPTEAEWEKAARGPDPRRFPWGDRWDPRRSNAAMRVKGTAPVGSYPEGAGPYGAHDMAGNVWEWVEDWFDPRYYDKAPERNPEGPDTGASKVTRGGAWNNKWTAVRTARRDKAVPGQRSHTLGFRCAKDAPR